MRLALLAVLCFAALSVPQDSVHASSNDYLLILDKRAGPLHYLESFKQGRPDPYSAALTAFGTPTRFRVDGNLCRVSWAKSGVTIGFASQLRPCLTANLFSSAWYGMSLHGARWHNRLGLSVGDTVEEVRSRYPNARFDDRRVPWLVLVRRHIDEFNFVALAVVVNRSGRVTSIEVPATYIY